MSRESRSDRRRTEIEAWGALIIRVLAFIFGVLLIAYDALLMSGQPVPLRLLLAAGGFSAMGSVIAASLAEIIRAARGRSSDE
jgi:hypothetical protein